MTETDPLTTAKQNSGGAAGLAAKLSKLAPEKSISPQAISQWTRVPAERVVDVETVSGVPREQLRPDLYRSVPEKAA